MGNELLLITDDSDAVLVTVAMPVTNAHLCPLLIPIFHIVQINCDDSSDQSVNILWVVLCRKHGNK